MADIKDKIKKLLALASSPNENEARDALLKAKELMAKHKLDECDFMESQSRELKQVVCKDVSWTTDSGDLWMTNLCQAICENYLCVSAWSTPRGTRTHTLVITGLSDDADLCKVAIEYAIGFVRGRIKIEQRRRPSANPKSIAAGYAMGFVEGLKMAFEIQKVTHEEEWGLVMVEPKEVTEYAESLGNKSVRSKNNGIDSLSYAKGEHDGLEFDKVKPIEAKEAV